MTSDLDLTELMQKRCDQYMRLAKTITPILLQAIHVNTPELVVYSLLIDAYKDGGRDMHAAVMSTFESTAKSAAT